LIIRDNDGFAVEIDRARVGGPHDWRPQIDVQVYEAVQRLKQIGYLADLDQKGRIYHLTSKGRLAASKVQMPLGEKAARQALTKRLQEIGLIDPSAARPQLSREATP
jgi:hypothetical protein